MLSRKSKTSLLVFLSFLLFLAGSAYLAFLEVVFPSLVPHHGGGERFTLNEANDFTAQIPWSANSRLHLTLHANDTVELYRDGTYVCECADYELVIERGGYALILLRSDSPVNGMFTARQEIPLEKRLSAIVIMSAGLICTAISFRTRNRIGKSSNEKI